MSTRVPCLVLASGVTALGTIRSLARAGIPANVVSREPGIAARSRWFRSSGPPPDAEAGVPAWLEGQELTSAVLIPGSDHAAKAVANLPEHLRNRFRASVSSPEVLETFTDKARFASLLEDIGVPAPDTRLISGGEVDGFPFHEHGTFFLKPTDSQAFFATFGTKAFHVAGAPDARARLQQATDAGLSLLVQEYVPGPASAHVFVDGFVDRKGRITGLLARRRLRMEPPDFGNSSCMVSVPLDDARGAVESMKRLLSEVGYRGIFSAEFKEDPRDGIFRLLEVNARSWWYVEFTARCGVNVCRMAYQDALDEDVDVVREYRTGVRLVYPEYDIDAFRRLRRQGELGFWSWARSWMGAQQPIFCLDDPAPAVSLFGSYLKRRLRRPRGSGAKGA